MCFQVDARNSGTDNESMNSSAKNDLELLLEELNFRYGLLQPFMDKEPLNLDAEQGTNASGEEFEEPPFMDDDPLEPDVGANQVNEGVERGADQGNAMKSLT
jgi:hypothetical protein